VAGTASATLATVCSGTGTTISLAGNTGTIQWQRFVGNDWQNIPDATSTSVATGNLTAATRFRAVVTSGVCTAVQSNEVTININAVAAITGHPASTGTDFTYGSNAIFSVTASEQTCNTSGRSVLAVAFLPLMALLLLRSR
jgi:hypothetical protein